MKVKLRKLNPMERSLGLLCVPFSKAVAFYIVQLPSSILQLADLGDFRYAEGCAPMSVWRSRTCPPRRRCGPPALLPADSFPDHPQQSPGHPVSVDLPSMYMEAFGMWPLGVISSSRQEVLQVRARCTAWVTRWSLPCGLVIFHCACRPSSSLPLLMDSWLDSSFGLLGRMLLRTLQVVIRSIAARGSLGVESAHFDRGQ